MTPPAPGSLSPAADRIEPPDTAVLEALAAAGEALTDAIVHHDFDAIVAATKRAEELVGHLNRRDAARAETRRRRVAASLVDDDPAEPQALGDDVIELGTRIAITARRNAMLLEHAWATDAALLRLLATAAHTEAQQNAGMGYAQRSPEPVPAGWLDRSA